MPKRLQRKSIYKSNSKPPHKKEKSGRRFTYLLIVMGVSFLWLGMKGRQLEKIVEAKFNVERRWNIPSRVYSDAEYIFPGYDVAKRKLVPKLERLLYRQVPKVKGPGDFSITANAIEIYLHDFAYPRENFTGFPVRLELKENVVQRIADSYSQENFPLIRLEPEEVATLFDEKMEDRTLLTINDCPSHLIAAIIVIEDERFFKHKGVDPVAIARAAVVDILALKIVQGGSTLTQQLVKNFFLTSNRSFTRKINEALMALIMEAKYTKAQILEAYLNEIYLGQRGSSSITGFAEAAKFYFGKKIHQVTVGEGAILAAMIRSPNEYAPNRHPEKAKGRRDLILQKMFQADVIDKSVYEEALAEPILTPNRKMEPAVAPYFIDFVKSQLTDFYSEVILETEGLRIFTTLDMTMQLEAVKAVTQGLKNIDTGYAHLFPKEYQGKLQSCLVAISPQNGYVRAMVGGRDYEESQYNRCTQARRQPGSTFKPFVYLTAFDPSRSKKIFTPATVVEDVSFTMKTPEGPWSPQNYDKEEHGPVTVRTALEKSYNIATAKVAMDVGLENVVKTAQDAGIQSELNPFPSLALGAFEVAPLELATAYAIFPNLGMRTQALAVMNVMTPQGEVLEKKTVKTRRVFDEAPVALVNSLLQGVVQRGTGAGAAIYGLSENVAGKTGTSSDFRDSWFVGFTPSFLSLVWVGFDDNTSVELSGATVALPLWGTFMKNTVGPSHEEFPFPDNIVRVKIDPTTGGLAGRSCSAKFEEVFIKGSEPTESCAEKEKEIEDLRMREADNVEEF
ncbi:MAG: PBP1A family penicillin-binding protein [Deltaproteobacteria bacterium]|nr:PBP1A family penicillin-binding protein [Deltaproteobacteria bacterium]